jgi:hypothetical protein
LPTRLPKDGILGGGAAAAAAAAATAQGGGESKFPGLEYAGALPYQPSSLVQWPELFRRLEALAFLSREVGEKTLSAD